MVDGGVSRITPKASLQCATLGVIVWHHDDTLTVRAVVQNVVAYNALAVIKEALAKGFAFPPTTGAVDGRSAQFSQMLQAMLTEDPAQRASTEALATHPAIGGTFEQPWHYGGLAIDTNHR